MVLLKFGTKDKHSGKHFLVAIYFLYTYHLHLNTSLNYMYAYKLLVEKLSNVWTVKSKTNLYYKSSMAFVKNCVSYFMKSFFLIYKTRMTTGLKRRK